MFTVFDPGRRGIYAAMRGRIAIFNELVREIADGTAPPWSTCWRMRDQAIAEVMDTDRMHLNPVGHQQIAFAVLDALGSSTTRSGSPARRCPS